jgi:hypothetical protein
LLFCAGFWFKIGVERKVALCKVNFTCLIPYHTFIGLSSETFKKLLVPSV